MSSKTLGKPEPHSDVINREPKTLLIGYGWVGQFVHKYFTKADIWTPSLGLVFKDGDQYVRIPDEQNQHWDLAFIGTPTPMNEDGSCDTSMVENAIREWHDQVDLFIIRSTVVPGTTERLANKYKTRVAMQPEYVGETLGHPLTEPRRDPFIILGGRKEDTQRAAEHWARVLHANARIRQVTALEAEYCKYMENCFLAAKVIFVNDWARLCRATGVDYLTLREAWLDDERVGRSHTLAYEDNPGFSGKCLPKDLNSIAYYARHTAGQPLELIEALLEINARMRENVTNHVPLLPKEGIVREKPEKRSPPPVSSGPPDGQDRG